MISNSIKYISIISPLIFENSNFILYIKLLSSDDHSTEEKRARERNQGRTSKSQSTIYRSKID